MDRLKSALTYCLFFLYALSFWHNAVPNYVHAELFHHHHHGIFSIVVDLMHELEHADFGDEQYDYYLPQRNDQLEKPTQSRLAFSFDFIEEQLIVAFANEAPHCIHPPPDLSLSDRISSYQYRGPPSIS